MPEFEQPSGLVPSVPGPREGDLSDIWAQLRGQLPGLLTAPQSVLQLSNGQMPDFLHHLFKQGLRQSLAGITESFGTQGARFGTDLAHALSKEAGMAGLAEQKQGLDYMQGANQTRLGYADPIQKLGTKLTDLEFNRSESALDRALQEFLGTLGGDDFLNKILPLIMGG